jgi:hypothetical protein
VLRSARGALDDHAPQRLPQLQPARRARLAPELDHLPRLRDLADERLVDERLDRLGPTREEHRFRRVLDSAGHDVPPEVLSEERHHRSDRADRLHDRDPQRPERGLVELVEAAARAADVPVREIVDEALPGARDVGRPEPLT